MLRSKTIKDADPVVRETESDSDCLADRAVALDDQKVSKVHCEFSRYTACRRYFISSCLIPSMKPKF